MTNYDRYCENAEAMLEYARDWARTGSNRSALYSEMAMVYAELAKAEAIRESGKVDLTE